MHFFYDFLYYFLYFSKTIRSSTQVYTNEEKKYLEELYKSIQNKKLFEKKRQDHMYFMISNSISSFSSANFGELEEEINKFCLCNLKEKNIFYVIKIHLYSSFFQISSIENIFLNDITHVFNGIKYENIKHSESNLFYHFEIHKEPLMVSEYLEEYSSNYNFIKNVDIPEKSQFFEHLIFLESDPTDLLLKDLLDNFFDIILTENYDISCFKYTILVNGRGVKVNENDFHELKKISVEQNTEMYIQYQIQKECLFYFNVSKETEFLLEEKNNLNYKNLDKWVCKTLNNSAFLYSCNISYDYIDNYSKKEIRYIRKSNDDISRRDAHILEIKCICFQGGYDYKIIIEAFSKVNNHLKNDLKIEIEYKISYNYNTTKIYKRNKDHLIHIKNEANNRKELQFTLFWYMNKNNNNFSDINSTSEKISYKKHLMLIENLKDLFTINSELKLSFNLNPEVFLWEENIWHLRDIKSKIVNYIKFRDFNFYDLLKSFLGIYIENYKNMTIKAFDFNYNKIKDTDGLCQYDEYEILGYSIPCIKETDFYLKELSKHSDVGEIEVNLYNKIEMLKDGILLDIKISEKITLNLVIRKLNGLKLEIDDKYKIYFDEFKSIIEDTLLDKCLDITAKHSKELINRIIQFKELLLSTWYNFIINLPLIFHKKDPKIYLNELKDQLRKEIEKLNNVSLTDLAKLKSENEINLIDFEKNNIFHSDILECEFSNMKSKNIDDLCDLLNKIILEEKPFNCIIISYFFR